MRPNIADLGRDEALLRPVYTFGRGFYTTLVILLAVIAWALFAWSYQLRYGLSVTGLNRPVFWGLYITNFVFFIGISHAGTLISAILRMCQAEWRRSITRSAEVITVMVIFFGVGNVLLDLGRPDRAFNVIFHGHLGSPLLWDAISISTYLVASTIYLWLPLIPDAAILRERGGRRQWFYRIVAAGWQGTPEQQKRLEKLISIMAIIVLPVAISVHTVVSWVFAMTIQPFWHSTIFGPFFVAGAIFSGIAALIIAMAIIRKAYRLEDYFKPVHFDYLGRLMLVMSLLWMYFIINEHLTVFYGAEPSHMAVFWEKLSGAYAVPFWLMVVTNFVIPIAILGRSKTRTVTGTVVASISIQIGMWLERFTIVVPTLVNPRLPLPRGAYIPSWVEVSLMAGCFAGFILFYMLFTKLFPIVSIWEVREGRELGVAETARRVATYLPSEELSDDRQPADSSIQ